MSKKKLGKKLREAIAEFENPANHAVLDARLTPPLMEAARENEEFLRRSREEGNKTIYR